MFLPFLQIYFYLSYPFCLPKQMIIASKFIEIANEWHISLHFLIFTWITFYTNLYYYHDILSLFIKCLLKQLSGPVETVIGVSKVGGRARNVNSSAVRGCLLQKQTVKWIFVLKGFIQDGLSACGHSDFRRNPQDSSKCGQWEEKHMSVTREEHRKGEGWQGSLSVPRQHSHRVL